MTTPLLTGMTATMTLTTGTQITLSRTAADDRPGANPMVIDEIRFQWSQDHALSHDNPAPITLTLRSRAPVATPQLQPGGLPVEGLHGAKITLTATGPNGQPITWYGWVNRWSCQRSTGRAPDRGRPYTIRLDLIDIIGRAQAIKLAATPWPSHKITERIQAASNAMAHIVPLDYAPLDAFSELPDHAAPRDVDNADLLEVLQRTVAPWSAWIRGGQDWIRFRLQPGTVLILHSNGNWGYGPGDFTDALPIHPSALSDAASTADRTDRFTRFTTETLSNADGSHFATIIENLPDTPWSTSVLSRPSDAEPPSDGRLRAFGRMSLGLPADNSGAPWYDDAAGGPQRRFKATAKAGYPRLGRVRFLFDAWRSTVSHLSKGLDALHWAIEPWSRSGSSVMITPCPQGVTQCQTIIGGELIWHPDPARQRLYFDLAPVIGRHHTELKFASLRDWAPTARLVPPSRSSLGFTAYASNGGLYA